MKKLTVDGIINSSLTCRFKFITAFIFFLFLQNVCAQFVTPVFENISIEDGLPENSVTCILQDYLGYLWLGTQNGLVRYDGYSMKVFQPEENDSLSISGRGITVLLEDKEKNLWIGTLQGLNKFDRANESFISYQFSIDDSNSVNSSEIYSIYIDRAGRFWVGTAEGLNLFDSDKGTFTRYYFRYQDPKVYRTSLSYQENLCVNAITEDPSSGNLLIGTAANGLFEFDIKNMTFSKYRFSNESNPDKKIGWIQSFYKAKDGGIWMTSYHTLCSLDPSQKEVNCYINFPINDAERHSKRDMPGSAVVEYHNGSIWCGFDAGGQGIFCLDPKTSYVYKYSLDPDVSSDSYGNNIFALYIDRSDILWAGSWGLGLWKWDKQKQKFLVPSNDSFNLRNLNKTTSYSFTYDPDGFIWLTSHRGLEKYDLKKGKFDYYLQSETCVTQDNIYVTFLDKSGYIWIATSSCGLLRFNPSNKSYRFFFNDPGEPVNLLNKIILTMYQDSRGLIWIGTDGSGFYKYDVANKKLTQYKHNPGDTTSITNDNTRSFYEDRSGTLWFGTNFGGLNKFDRKTETFKYCGFSCVLSIYEDKKGNFWVADYYSGLNLFDRNKNKVIRCYGRKDGLLSNSIWGILEDDYNNLWIKTDNGLFKFNTSLKTFKRYTTEDGLADNFFLPFPHSYGIGPDGLMLFNTSKFYFGKGLVIFHPDRIKDDPVPPQVVISNISLFNHPGEVLDLKGFIPDLKKISIPYNQNDLRIDFAGLQFSEPEKNNYKYILENFDEDWIDAGNQRNATYTNLAPGEYVFKVMAANRDGIWNKEAAALKIIITPPWWKTNLAYFLFALIIISLVYLIWRMQLKRIRIKQEFDMSRFEAEKMHEVDTIKTRFFTNISHEFRTPLTLIMGPSRQIMEMTDNDRIIENAKLINRSAKKLNRLASQLLDISRIEAGHMKLKVTQQNIIPVICDIASSFQSFAERKKIVLKFQTDSDEIMLYIDRDKIDKMMSNILSNAIKFTPEDGSVCVHVNRLLPGNDFIEIAVSDTGIGIPNEQLDKIFDRFYQVDNRISKKYEGTGVGLSLTRELAELHKGKIIVESEEGKGSIFRLLLPLGKKQFSPDELSSDKAEEIQIMKTETLLSPVLINPVMKNKNNGEELLKTDNKPLVLIIEDNSELRNYIKDILWSAYSITEACDGEEGLKKSAEQMPNLIISDIMMPGMDGIELCNRLKSDPETSHIPLIFLTAKATLKDKIEGLETGADDYIMKPFDADELKVRIKNLLGQKARLHEYFRKHGLFEIDEKQVTPLDRQFLQKAMEIINEHISDSSFSTEAFADSLAISRSLLNKKLTALIGEPPGELIRRTRLNKAAEMIKNNSGNFTEIAFEVGFKDPSYFSVCFRKQFGMSPSDYLHSTVKG